MKKSVALLIAFIIVFSLFACKNGREDNTVDFDDTTVQSLSESSAALTDTTAVNFSPGWFVPDMWAVADITAEFAFDMLKDGIVLEKNTIISPVSIMAALAMAACGAGGDTLKETEAVLGADVETLKTYFGGYLKNENYLSNGVTFANSVWINSADARLTVNPNFITCCRDSFDAEVFEEKFDKKALKKLNRWVSDNTDGAIKNMLDKIPNDAVIYLINTVLFDAEWQNKYEHSDVLKDMIFTSEDGRKQKVTMLSSEEPSTKYFTLGMTEGISREYTNGFSFAAILPNEGTTVAQALNSFSGEDFVLSVTKKSGNQNLSAQDTVFDAYPIKVYLPKFEFEYNIKLSDTLKKLGMPLAFDEEKADFKNMAAYAGGNIYMNEVFHNAYISLGEKGTKAGAATTIEMATESMPMYNIILNFNRPFIFVIYETSSGLPLFAGTVTDFEQ